jgi:hypothetical protein
MMTHRGTLGLAGLVVLASLIGGWSVRAGDQVKPAAPASASARAPSLAEMTAKIDQAIAAGWAESGIKPSPQAPDAEFLRRSYLDLVGRIPTLDEAASFLASKDTDRRAKLIEHLLAHPDAAKNFGTIWQVMLIGRGNRDRQVDAAALSGWLRRQFAEDRPWNEVANDLITASGSNKENGAVNFITAHLGDRERGGSYAAVNLTSLTTRVFLGQQIQCTQCHDHPSNDWKQADFWGINAFFKGVRQRDETTTNAVGVEQYAFTTVEDEPTEAWSTYEKRNAIIGIAFPTFLDGRKISQGTDVDRRKALGAFITDRENLQFARAMVNRTWGHFFGRGFTSPVDDMGDHTTVSHPELLEDLALAFRASNYDVKVLMRWIMSSKAYQLTSVATKENAADDSLFSHMALKPMTPEQLFDSLLAASNAHKDGGSAASDDLRRRWLGQFLFTFGNDEGEEGSSFQGTIPQALMMMNGEAMARATSSRPGTTLARLREQSLSQRREPPETVMVRGIYLAALSRYPTAPEMTRARALLGSSYDRMPALEDLFWSLLNSNEFVLNH